MRRPITAETRLIALLGDPVRHSLSPIFQNAAIQAAGLDAAYLALRCSPSSLPSLLHGIAAAGGAGNITVPYKEAAASAIARPTDAVVRTGACNTFWYEDDAIHGDNTDVVGFLTALELLLGGSPAGARVLLLGAGGSATAVVHALASARASEIVVTNRTRDRATALCERMAIEKVQLQERSIGSVGSESFDLVVNATSVGLRPEDPFPLDLDSGPTFSAAFDLVYAPGRTRWVNALRSRGVPAEDGLEMLLHQGAAAFERWFGIEAPLQAMRGSLPRR